MEHKRCEHEWWVHSTALATRQLMVKCDRCQVLGTVDDLTKHEWGEAFYASSAPYRWYDPERVVNWGCDHDWWIYGIALGSERRILVTCEKCNAKGRVDYPSTHEYREAEAVLNSGYRWYDPDRVIVEESRP